MRCGRASLCLMLYLIFTRQINVGQFMVLWFYSFFIFGPLQEMGNVINVYRETEVSLKNFDDILKMEKEPRPEHPVVAGTAGPHRVRRRRRSGISQEP